MLALRLARRAHPVVQFRRLLVAAASGGTGFLLLCALGHALSHPHAPSGSALRLLWCLAPAAATVHFAVAVARTDPGTRPRPGLSAVGLGPVRLMAVSAVTTALSTTLGSVLALFFFLHLRGDLTGTPFDGSAADVLAADRPLPLPAALTLLALVPVVASVTTALVLRPKDTRPRPAGPRRRFMAYDTFEVRRRVLEPAGATRFEEEPEPEEESTATAGPPQPPAPRPAPGGLPWGIAVLAVGLTVETYAGQSDAGSALTLPGGLADSPAGVLGGWLLTASGLVLAGPGLTHLTGRLVQAVRPGALRLLAGRVLQAEARRIGRPLGVVCAVASGAYAMVTLSASAPRPTFGPLTVLGALVVAGCTVLTLVTAAVEARQAHADTTAALLRLGAPAALPRKAALLRAGALLAVFGPLTWTVADLAAVPLAS